MRLRRRHIELVPWLILWTLLVAVIGAALCVFLSDVERIHYDDSDKTIKCAHCSNTKHHVHHGYQHPHQKDY